jgi:hypothetical protein
MATAGELEPMDTEFTTGPDGDFSIREPKRRRRMTWHRNASIGRKAARAQDRPVVGHGDYRAGPRDLDEVLEWACSSVRYISEKDRAG